MPLHQCLSIYEVKVHFVISIQSLKSGVRAPKSVQIGEYQLEHNVDINVQMNGYGVAVTIMPLKHTLPYNFSTVNATS